MACLSILCSVISVAPFQCRCVVAKQVKPILRSLAGRRRIRAAAEARKHSGQLSHRKALLVFRDDFGYDGPLSSAQPYATPSDASFPPSRFHYNGNGLSSRLLTCPLSLSRRISLSVCVPPLSALLLLLPLLIYFLGAWSLS